MADIIQEKPNSSPLGYLTSNAIFAQASSVLSSWQQKREALGLPNPGTVDNLSKEVERDVFLNNYSFTGLRADITKTFSGGSPLFQVSHQLSMGSQAQPPYTFAALYGSSRVCGFASTFPSPYTYTHFSASCRPTLTTISN
jgi:mitochondrial import receptor subunit TOM40